MKPKTYSCTFRYENIHDRDQGGGAYSTKFYTGRGGSAPSSNRLNCCKCIVFEMGMYHITRKCSQLFHSHKFFF